MVVELVELQDVEEELPWIWGASFFKEMTTRVEARYGNSCLSEEFDSKNIYREHGVTRAIGVNLKQSLPGLYWMNFFGPLYADLIGDQRIMSTPAVTVRRCGSGALIILDETPLNWRDPDYKKRESEAIDHLGNQFFYCRSDPERKTVAPDYDKKIRGT